MFVTRTGYHERVYVCKLACVVVHLEFVNYFVRCVDNSRTHSKTTQTSP